MAAQNIFRYNAVLKFLHLQKLRQTGETKIELALKVARCFNRGEYFVERLITWIGKLERDSRREARMFPEDSTWFNEESVQLAVRA